MQSTGQTSTQELSFSPMQGSAMTYATGAFPSGVVVATAAPIGRRGTRILGQCGPRWVAVAGGYGPPGDPAHGSNRPGWRGAPAGTAQREPRGAGAGPGPAQARRAPGGRPDLTRQH